MYLVWQRGPRGPEPTIWYDMDLSWPDKAAMVVHYVAVPEHHRNLTIDQLALTYPIPEGVTQ